MPEKSALPGRLGVPVARGRALRRSVAEAVRVVMAFFRVGDGRTQSFRAAVTDRNSEAGLEFPLPWSALQGLT